MQKARQEASPLSAFDDIRARHRSGSVAVLQGPHAALLRLQQAQRQGLRRRARQLLALGHAEIGQKPIRHRQGVLRDRFHREPPEVRRADRGPAREMTIRSIVPIGAAGLMAAKMVKDTKLKVIPGAPHGMCAPRLRDRDQRRPSSLHQVLATPSSPLTANTRANPADPNGVGVSSDC
jgi:hypothetical protein